MWDKTSPLLRKVRPILGGVTLSALVALPFFFSASNPGVLLANAGEASTLMIGDRESEALAVAPNGANIQAFDGTTIYHEREDGTGEIVGSLSIRDGVLYAQVSEEFQSDHELAWNAPILRLDDGIQLLFGAEGVEREIKRLESTLIPVINKHILPPMTDILRLEFEKLVKETLEKEQGELETIAAKLSEKLAPEIETLSNKLVETAWERIGVWGVAEGLWRKGSSAIGSAAKGAWKWGKSFFGDDEEESKEEATPFLSDERKKELRIAIEEDIAEFWKDNSKTIMQKGTEVVGSREDLLNRLEKRVTDRFSEVAVATFRKHAHHIEAPLTNFANSLGLRHMVTADGAPRLTLAYAIRSGTGLTSAPLVIIRPSKDARDKGISLVPYNPPTKKVSE